MKNNFFPFAVALVLILLLTALFDPFMVLMPPPLAMLCMLLAAALITVFAGFMLHEGAADEREEAHRLSSGRAAYLAGLAVLTLGLLVQGTLAHHVDPWILGAIGAMIVVKIAARFLTDLRN